MRISFSEAAEILKKVKVVSEDSDESNVVLILADGRKLRFSSNYEDDWSPNTPGNGIQPPTVELEEPLMKHP